MTRYAIILAAAVLGGCAVAPPGPGSVDTHAYAAPADPGQWRVVSVTPVPTGTAARAGEPLSDIDYSSQPSYGYAPAYAPAPVYVAPPLYAPPLYAPAPTYQPYWYPPISIGLGLNFSRSWRHHHRGSRGGHRGHRRGR